VRRFRTVTTLARWPFPVGNEIWYWDTFRPYWSFHPLVEAS